jgi:hypothetical protein
MNPAKALYNPARFKKHPLFRCIGCFLRLKKLNKIIFGGFFLPNGRIFTALLGGQVHFSEQFISKI